MGKIMVDIIILDPVNRYLWAMATFILILCGIHYIYRGRKKEEMNDKRIMYGFGGFWLGLGITRILFYFSDFFIQGNYTGHIYTGVYSDKISPYYEIAVQGGYICWIIGMLLFFYEFERVISKTKYIFTLFNLCSVFLAFILPFDLSRAFIYLLAVMNIFIILLILIWFSKRSSREFQAVSSLMLVGLFLFFIGWAADASVIKESNIIHPNIPPILIIVGALVAISPTIINPEAFSKSITNWTIFLVFNFILIVFVLMAAVGLNLLATYKLPFGFTILGWVICGLFIISIVYLIFRIIKLIKPPKVLGQYTIDEKEKLEFLKGFTKRKKITEEEVALYKEKKICLVCKGKIGGFNVFLCPKCDVLYCGKCAQVLSTLENICWICNTPLDETKPVRKIEKEEELKIETLPKK